MLFYKYNIIRKKHYIQRLIDEGEGLHLDFKFEVSDAAKIARSLVAFANTDGGKLLIGVKDNGKISGIRSEEEFYMLQNAAQRYCKPEVGFSSKEWNIAGKKVLEVTIPVSENKPHKAPDIAGKYKVYIRFEDQNILAHTVQVKVWQKQNAKGAVKLTFTDEVKNFLSLFREGQLIDYDSLMDKTELPRSKTVELLSDLIAMKAIRIHTTDLKTSFSLTDESEYDN